MKIRRYYRRGQKYDYYIRDEYYEVLIKKYGVEKAEIIDNAELDIVLEPEEQKSWFDDCCNRILENPRFYLDNVEKLATFRVQKRNVYK